MAVNSYVRVTKTLRDGTKVVHKYDMDTWMLGNIISIIFTIIMIPIKIVWVVFLWLIEWIINIIILVLKLIWKLVKFIVTAPFKLIKHLFSH